MRYVILPLLELGRLQPLGGLIATAGGQDGEQQ
jgi:hypothetical protein